MKVLLTVGLAVRVGNLGIQVQYRLELELSGRLSIHTVTPSKHLPRTELTVGLGKNVESVSTDACGIEV